MPSTSARVRKSIQPRRRRPVVARGRRRLLDDVAESYTQRDFLLKAILAEVGFSEEMGAAAINRAKSVLAKRDAFSDESSAVFDGVVNTHVEWTASMESGHNKARSDAARQRDLVEAILAGENGEMTINRRDALDMVVGLVDHGTALGMALMYGFVRGLGTVGG